MRRVSTAVKTLMRFTTLNLWLLLVNAYWWLLINSALPVNGTCFPTGPATNSQPLQKLLSQLLASQSTVVILTTSRLGLLFYKKKLSVILYMTEQLGQCFHRILTLSFSVKMWACGIGFGMLQLLFIQTLWMLYIYITEVRGSLILL